MVGVADILMLDVRQLGKMYQKVIHILPFTPLKTIEASVFIERLCSELDLTTKQLKDVYITANKVLAICEKDVMGKKQLPSCAAAVYVALMTLKN